MDAAQALLSEAEVRFSHEPALAVELAWMALARGDLAGAIDRWADVRRRMPDFWPGYTGGSTALRDARLFDEAAALLAEAIARFPSVPQPAVEAGHLAMARRDWPAAFLRWQAVATAFPDRIEGYTGQAHALRELGRLADAEQALRQATARFPGQLELSIDLAWVVTHQNRHDDAALLWEQLRARFPGHVVGFTGGAVALGNGQRGAEAMALLDQAAAQFPDDPGPPTERGWFAMNQGDFIVAHRVFAAVRDRFPDHPVAPLGLGRALRALGRIDEAAALLRAAVARFPTFDLLATDLAELVGAEPIPEPETPVAVAAPDAIRTGPIKIAVAGYHLANQIASILARLAPLNGRVIVERLDIGASVDTIRDKLPFGWLESTDLYVEEGLIGPAAVKTGLRALLPRHCAVRTMPTSGCLSLWPFGGRDDRLVPEPPVYNGGRYPNTDAIAASLAGSAMTDDALFDAYMALTEAAPLNLDASFASDLTQWRRDDQACDVQLAPFIEANFRDQRLFTTPHERCTPILREIAQQLLATPMLKEAAAGADLERALDRLLLGWTASHQGLPVHPRVGRHFELRWWSPDMRYRTMGNDFTFREHILRTIRWSPWLP